MNLLLTKSFIFQIPGRNKNARRNASSVNNPAGRRPSSGQRGRGVPEAGRSLCAAADAWRESTRVLLFPSGNINLFNENRGPFQVDFRGKI